jgi:putative membrane protein
MFEALTALASNEVVYHGPPVWWPIFPLFWLLLILTLVIVFARSRRRWGGCGYHGHGRGGLEHLAERYAAGEIDETEYRNRRAVLEEQFDRRR